MGMMTVGRLIELFPEYEEEIKGLSNEFACGCSLCVWNNLKLRHDELVDTLIPENSLYLAWG